LPLLFGVFAIYFSKFQPISAFFSFFSATLFLF